MPRDFLSVLDDEVLLCDGAMGTLLMARGVPAGSCLEERNLSDPVRIKEVHVDYIAAGAQIVETNTWGAHPLKLDRHGLAARCAAINLAGARLAREAAGTEVWVAGSVGPTGALLRPYGVADPGELRGGFDLQIRSLTEGGVDLLLIETMSSLAEALLAVRGAREAARLPVICQMSILEDGKTKYGEDIRRCVGELLGAGADVVGINCSVGPRAVFDVIRTRLAVRDYKLSVQPNAGYPTEVDGRSVFLSTPAYFRDYARQFLELGVNIIGGCCGTTPAHIRAMAEVARGARPRPARGQAVEVEVEVREPEPRVREEVRPPHGFAARLGKEFVMTAEVDPPHGLGCAREIEGARLLKTVGIDAVSVGDNPLARVRMSSIALAHLLRQETGVEVILHFTTRDRNLLGLQSELLGAAALGIGAVLALKGDPTSVGDFPKATSVFDVDSIGLVRLLRGLNQGVDLANNPLDRPTEFLIGVAVNPASEDVGREIARLKEKIEAGAHFAMTQPLFDIAILRRFVERARGEGLPILVGVLPLRTHRHAEFLHNEVPGIAIPDGVRERMRAASAGGKEAEAKEGVAIAAEFLQEARELVAGAAFMPPFARYEMVAEILSR